MKIHVLLRNYIATPLIATDVPVSTQDLEQGSSLNQWIPMVLKLSKGENLVLF